MKDSAGETDPFLPGGSEDSADRIIGTSWRDFSSIFSKDLLPSQRLLQGLQPSITPPLFAPAHLWQNLRNFEQSRSVQSSTHPVMLSEATFNSQLAKITHFIDLYPTIPRKNQKKIPIVMPQFHRIPMNFDL